MSEITVNDDNFEEQVKNAKGVVLVDFWAEWCGPCKMMEPVLEQLASEYDGKATIAKLNVDENPNTAQAFGITSIPNMKIFKDGEVVDEIVGAQGKDAVAEKLDAQIS